MNAALFSEFLVLLIKQTTDCFSDVCSTEQKCQLSHRLFNWFNALIFLEKNCVPSPNFLILSPQLRQFSETLGVDPTGDRPFLHLGTVPQPRGYWYIVVCSRQ